MNKKSYILIIAVLMIIVGIFGGYLNFRKSYTLVLEEDIKSRTVIDKVYASFGDFILSTPPEKYDTETIKYITRFEFIKRLIDTAPGDDEISLGIYEDYKIRPDDYITYEEAIGYSFSAFENFHILNGYSGSDEEILKDIGILNGIEYNSIKDYAKAEDVKILLDNLFKDYGIPTVGFAH